MFEVAILCNTQHLPRSFMVDPADHWPWSLQKWYWRAQSILSLETSSAMKRTMNSSGWISQHRLKLWATANDIFPDELTFGEEETQSVEEMTLTTFTWLWPSAPMHTAHGFRGLNPRASSHGHHGNITLTEPNQRLFLTSWWTRNRKRNTERSRLRHDPSEIPYRDFL